MAAGQNKHVKVACVAGAVLAIVAGGVLHWRVVSNRLAALVALEADVCRAADASGTESRAARDLPALRRAAARLAKRLPPDPNLTSVLGSAAADPPADVVPEREIVSKPTIPGHPVARVPFLLQYRGSFASTVNLLRRLQDGPLLARVEHLVVESESTAVDGDKPLRVQVEFSTFARTSKELEAWSRAE